MFYPLKHFTLLRANYFFKNFNQYLYANPTDPGYMHPDSLNTSIVMLFMIKEQIFTGFSVKHSQYTAKLDFSSQVTENHLVQFGAEGKSHHLSI